MVMNYEQIAKFLTDSKVQSKLSMNDITSVVEMLPAVDRPMFEVFTRVDLKRDMLTDSHGLTRIPAGLYMNSELTELFIPKTIKTIQLDAFNGSKIAKITIEAGALGGTLDLSVFENMPALKVIDIPDTILEINDAQGAATGRDIELKNGQLPYTIFASSHWCDKLEDETITLDVDDATGEALFSGGIKQK